MPEPVRPFQVHRLARYQPNGGSRQTVINNKAVSRG
jgi:hypothetical protein